MTTAQEGGEWSAAPLGRYLRPGKDTVPILQEAVWAPGPVWTGGKSRPHRDSIPDRPARSQSLYRLSYRSHTEFGIIFRNEVPSREGLFQYFFFSHTYKHFDIEILY